MRVRILCALCLLLVVPAHATEPVSGVPTSAPAPEISAPDSFPPFKPVFRLWIPGDADRTGFYRLNFSPYGGETPYARPETKPAIETMPIR